MILENKLNITDQAELAREEKRNYMFKKHIKDHLLEYILEFAGPIILTIIILYLCKAQEFVYGVILSIVYSLGKVLYDLYHYKKEYINIDIK